MEFEYRTKTTIKKSIILRKGSKRKAMDFQEEEDFALQPKQKKTRKEKKPSFSFLSTDCGMPIEQARREAAYLMSDPTIYNFYQQNRSSFSKVAILDRPTKVVKRNKLVVLAENNNNNRPTGAVASKSLPAIANQQLPAITETGEKTDVVKLDESDELPEITAKPKKSDDENVSLEEQDSIESARSEPFYVVTKFDPTKSLKMTLKKVKSQ